MDVLQTFHGAGPSAVGMVTELYQRVGRGVHWMVWDLSMTNSIFKG